MLEHVAHEAVAASRTRRALAAARGRTPRARWPLSEAARRHRELVEFFFLIDRSPARPTQELASIPTMPPLGRSACRHHRLRRGAEADSPTEGALFAWQLARRRIFKLPNGPLFSRDTRRASTASSVSFFSPPDRDDGERARGEEAPHRRAMTGERTRSRRRRVPPRGGRRRRGVRRARAAAPSTRRGPDAPERRWARRRPARWRRTRSR